MPTRPSQGGSTGTWGTELNSWLDVSLNADGTLKSGGGGGSGAPLQADYLFTTDGTTITRYDRTGAVSATGTDIGALVNGVAANYIAMAFASGIFPWTTMMDLDLFIGMTLRGAGGRQNENKGSTGGRAATQFKWTPASGQAFSAVGTQGLRLSSISFQWTHASYTSGDGTEDAIPFMSIEGVDHNTPTRHCLIEDCYMGVVSGGTSDSGGPILDINKTVNIAIRDCLFVGGTMHLRSHHTNTSDDFANVVEITGTRFSRGKTTAFPSIRGSGESWAIRNCHWEPSQTNCQWILDTVIEQFKGLVFEDCWVGDQGSGSHPANTAFINWNGIGLRILGGRWDLGGDYSLVRINGSIAGGLNITNAVIDNINVSTHGVIDCQDFGVKGLVINNPGSWPTTGSLVYDNATAHVVEPPLTNQAPYRALTANTSLQHSDHGRTIGVNVTSAPATMTLPNAACVGCQITVIKTDAGGNSVTVAASNGSIQGSGTYALASQYKYVTVQATGSIWVVVGSN